MNAGSPQNDADFEKARQMGQADNLTGQYAAAMAPADPTPRQLCALALKQGAGIDVIERFSALAERWDETEAKRKYSEAIANFQRKCPVIAKTRKADRYRYSAYEDVWVIVRPILGEDNIVVTYTEPASQDSKFVMVCRVRVGVYFEDHPFVAPWPDLKSIMGLQKISEPQAMATVLSYYKRYALCNALNIVCGDEDTDGAVFAKGLSEDQVGKIHTLIDECETKKIKHDHRVFLGIFGVTDGNTGDIPTSQFAAAVKMLEAKLGRTK